MRWPWLFAIGATVVAACGGGAQTGEGASSPADTEGGESAATGEAFLCSADGLSDVDGSSAEADGLCLAAQCTELSGDWLECDEDRDCAAVNIGTAECADGGPYLSVATRKAPQALQRFEVPGDCGCQEPKGVCVEGHCALALSP